MACKTPQIQAPSDQILLAVLFTLLCIRSHPYFVHWDIYGREVKKCLLTTDDKWVSVSTTANELDWYWLAYCLFRVNQYCLYVINFKFSNFPWQPCITLKSYFIVKNLYMTCFFKLWYLMLIVGSPADSVLWPVNVV